MSILLLFSWLAQPALAQQSDEKRSGNFYSLRTSRAELLRNIEEEQRTLADLQQRIQRAEENARAYEHAQRMMKEALERKERNRKDFWANEARKLSALERDPGPIAKELGAHQASLAGFRSRLGAVESEMNDLLSVEVAEQRFRTWVSVIFAILVAVVIFGFFYIAKIDSTVRRRVFSGQSGIQFLTLFALVIAIILFGITKVLEGKELSALLGGIAGYILGRSTDEARNGAKSEAGDGGQHSAGDNTHSPQ
jgi:small-conductance mechanosensitive channel